jgi:hypothetical protein
MPARSTVEWFVCRAILDDMQAVKFTFGEYPDLEVQAEFWV